MDDFLGARQEEQQKARAASAAAAGSEREVRRSGRGSKAKEEGGVPCAECGATGGPMLHCSGAGCAVVLHPPVRGCGAPTEAQWHCAECRRGSHKKTRGGAPPVGRGRRRQGRGGGEGSGGGGGGRGGGGGGWD